MLKDSISTIDENCACTRLHECTLPPASDRMDAASGTCEDATEVRAAFETWILSVRRSCLWLRCVHRWELTLSKSCCNARPFGMPGRCNESMSLQGTTCNHELAHLRRVIRMILR